MDESGYSFNWKADLDKQPYYVLSAVCLPSKQLLLEYQEIRSEDYDLNLEGATQPLEQGFEIKAYEIAKGSSYWKTHNNEHYAVREIMLASPKKYGGTAIVVVIYKLVYRERYAYPADPYQLSLEFIFERLQTYLSDISDYVISIYDQNKRLEDILPNTATALV